MSTNKYFLKSLLFSAFLICLTISCSPIVPGGPKPRSEKSACIGQVLKKTNKVCTKRHKMDAGGFGNAAMDKIKELTLIFSMNRKLSKDEIREVLVDCAHEMIKNVHECEGIQKYLLPEGFSEKNVEIIISFTNKRKDVFHPDIMIASIRNGKIEYCTKIPEEKYGYKETTEETYQEAIAALRSQGKLEFKEETTF